MHYAASAASQETGLIREMIRIGAVAVILAGVMLTPVRSVQASEGSPDTKLCSTCHATRQIAGVHQKVSGGQGDCLICHRPHTRAGPPYLRTPQKERCTVCHFEYGTKTLGENQKAGHVVHAPLLDQKCEECHVPHDLGAPARYQGGDKNASCTGCHAKTMAQRRSSYQHAPFQTNFCTDCHNPHQSKESQLLRMPLSQLCGSCHKGAQEKLGLPVQHKPFSTGLCTDCHDAHAGNYPKNLRVSVGELCRSCHVPEQKAVQHAPYRDGTCTHCHSPHASQTKRLLTVDSTTALCAKCHGGEVEKFSLASRHPVGQLLECTSCHRPHAADSQKLLPAAGSAFCTTCHLNQGRFYGNIGHSKVAVSQSQEIGACTNCHLPHGSANASLLKGQNGVSLCRACHQPKSQFEHPTGAKVPDPRTGKPVVCSSCHDPHGTQYSHSTRNQGDRLCLSCHE